MKQTLLAPLICMSLAAPLPLIAQEAPPGSQSDDSATEEGGDNGALMREGLRLLMEGLSGGLDDTLDDMGEAAEEAAPKIRDFVMRMGPAMADALSKVGDLANYEAPTVLPNGDILIKRRDDAPRYAPPVPGENPDGSIDL
ncbi:hypothetical protein PSM7751_03362 [Pseudooceanicola marinus]|uniref:AAA+ family ATPase n=1 Tax=Pseudooceanicola marinus TaxID=396013 RepID=A0A1X6ZZ85_9RHOB|nr:hypothetical protein [Pseudooceanicola marinus]PJE30102.1 hypothetical protein CVM50_11460 [Pseudooceanicola marinus]SLN65551.1 hypothetical protein PSM7751_03362 [Pseudooceanicola marinus]